MNDRSSAMWQWYSTQGTTCAENRDACGIFQSTAYTFSVVVDVAPRGERGIQFNTSWITAVLDRMSPEPPSVAAVLAALHEGQKHLRTEGFFAEKASYAAFLLPRGAKDAYAFYCGDCTLGARSPDGSIEWLTRTHTLVTALAEEDINADASKRRILTCTLNAKRFQKPDVQVVPTNASALWVLATDGYRYRESDDTGHPKDDCSALLIGSGLEAEPAAAHNNLFVRRAQNPTATIG